MDFLFVIELRRAKADEKRRHEFLPLEFASQKRKRQKDKLIETRKIVRYFKKRQSRWREKKRYSNKTEITAKANNKQKNHKKPQVRLRKT